MPGLRPLEFEGFPPEIRLKIYSLLLVKYNRLKRLERSAAQLDSGIISDSESDSKSDEESSDEDVVIDQTSGHTKDGENISSKSESSSADGRSANEPSRREESSDVGIPRGRMVEISS